MTLFPALPVKNYGNFFRLHFPGLTVFSLKCSWNLPVTLSTITFVITIKMCRQIHAQKSNFRYLALPVFDAPVPSEKIFLKISNFFQKILHWKRNRLEGSSTRKLDFLGKKSVYLWRKWAEKSWGWLKYRFGFQWIYI